MESEDASQQNSGQEPLVDLTAAMGASSSSVVPAQHVADTEIVLAIDPDDTEQAARRLLPPHPAD
jgi:hypothetical protein